MRARLLLGSGVARCPSRRRPAVWPDPSFGRCAMSALLVGYARCSTDQQDLTAQCDGLRGLGVEAERIYVDHGLTGTNRERPGLPGALPACGAGDPGGYQALPYGEVSARCPGDSLRAHGTAGQPLARRLGL